MRKEQEQRELDYKAMLDVALTMPGSTGNTYSRFHSYSRLNQTLFYMQGIEPQPVATFQRWRDVGRHVLKGSKAKQVIRPITVKLKDQLDDQGNPKTMTRFKLVNAIFALSDTEGPELPPVETAEWSLERALDVLDIKRVPFRMFEGNVQGYATGRNLAISEVATDPLATAIHECGHIVLGHTAPEALAEYQTHRGIKEFQAESTAYLALNELEELTAERATESRGYIQGWLKGSAKPSDQAIRQVFTATDKIVNAGREQIISAEVA